MYGYIVNLNNKENGLSLNSSICENKEIVIMEKFLGRAKEYELVKHRCKCWYRRKRKRGAPTNVNAPLVAPSLFFLDGGLVFWRFLLFPSRGWLECRCELHGRNRDNDH